MTSKLKVNILADGGDNAIMTSDGSGSLTLNNTALKMSPAVIGYQSSDQDLTKNSYNKIVNWTTTLDTDSAFSSNKFTVPSGEAGKYLINWQLKFDGDSSGNTGYDLNRMSVFINGSEVLQTDHVREPQIIYGAFVQFGTLDLSVSDYLEFYFYPDRGGGTAGDTVGETGKTYFTILKLIGV